VCCHSLSRRDAGPKMLCIKCSALNALHYGESDISHMSDPT
jgi:hypothetical protein